MDSFAFILEKKWDLSSLKGQLGRDTGRFISNKIFGNRHATKFQNVGTIGNLLGGISEGVETLKTEFTNSSKKHFQKKATNIAALKVPKQKEELIDMLNFLVVEVSSNNWEDNGDNNTELSKYSNVYLDTVLKKYEQCLFFLITKFPNATLEIEMYKKQLIKVKLKRFWQKNWLFLVAIPLLLAFLIMVYINR